MPVLQVQGGRAADRNQHHHDLFQVGLPPDTEQDIRGRGQVVECAGFQERQEMKVHIETIPYESQRYQTCGDYWADKDGVTQFRINDMGNEDYAFLVSIHEQIEEHLTRRRGLKEPDIMAFDVMWEKELQEGKHDNDGLEEPGHDPRAPYHREHVLSENVERLLAHAMGINWAVYEKAVEDSCSKPHPLDNSL